MSIGRLRVLLEHALELAPGERTAWLAELQRTEPADARELEHLLAAEQALDAARFLESGADPPAPGLAGWQLGGWTLERPLGQGGMGTVWLARRSDDDAGLPRNAAATSGSTPMTATSATPGGASDEPIHDEQPGGDCHRADQRVTQVDVVTSETMLKRSLSPDWSRAA